MITGSNVICDQCKQVEDNMHILCCQAPLAIKYREEPLHKLASRMAKLDTHPDLVTVVIYSGRNINGNVLIDVKIHPEETCLSGLICKQNKVGWFSFSWGFGQKIREKSKKNSCMSLTKIAILKDG